MSDSTRRRLGRIVERQGSAQQRMLRGRALVVSIAFSAVAARFDGVRPTLTPAFLVMALVVSFLDLACRRRLTRPPRCGTKPRWPTEHQAESGHGSEARI